MGVSVVSAKEVSDLELDQARREILEMRLKITRSQRYRTIAGIFAKHGLLHLLEDRGLFRLFFKKRTREEEEKLHRFGRRLRMVFEELGPTLYQTGTSSCFPAGNHSRAGDDGTFGVVKRSSSHAFPLYGRGDGRRASGRIKGV